MPIDTRTDPAGPDSSEDVPQPRRYDVDWLRTLAMGLLIVFHTVLSFMPWAAATGFPQNDRLLEGLWPLVAMLAVWRIPILFVISGMGVRFAMEHRDWKLLVIDRTTRILLPYVFGILVLNAIFAATLPRLGWEAKYTVNFGHLWFLLNIYLYTVWLIGLMLYLKDNPDNAFFRFLSKLIRWPFGLFLVALPLMVETWLVNPEYFAIYIDNVHGWLVGLICFFLGFLFISIQDVFWPAVARIRWIALGVACSLFLVRFWVFEPVNELSWLTALESTSWMLAIFGFGSLHLNKPSRLLGYFSKAVYPVYIIHLPVQFTLAYFLLPLSLSPLSKLTVMLMATFGVSLLLYEVVPRRLKWIRPLFGMKLNVGD